MKGLMMGSFHPSRPISEKYNQTTKENTMSLTTDYPWNILPQSKKKEEKKPKKKKAKRGFRLLSFLGSFFEETEAEKQLQELKNDFQMRNYWMAL